MATLMIVKLGLSGANLLLWQNKVLVEFLGTAAPIAVLFHCLNQRVKLMVIKERMRFHSLFLLQAELGI